MPKPVVGITPEFLRYDHMYRHILASSYTNSVQAAGGIPFVVGHLKDAKEDIDAILDRMDALVLSGGRDLNPELYGESPGPHTKVIQHPRRESTDKALINKVLERRMPLLAICLGFQEVNVHRGGSLYQDTFTEVDNHEVHRIGDGYTARHVVTLKPDSLIARVVGTNEVETNSAHHQAVKDLAPGFFATGWAADGVIESYQSDDQDLPLLAVQWHPEMEKDDRVGLNLFRWLVSQAS